MPLICFFIKRFQTAFYSTVCLNSNYSVETFNKFLYKSFLVHLDSSGLVSLFISVLFKECPGIPVEVSSDIIIATITTFKEISKFPPLIALEDDVTLENKWRLATIGHSAASFTSYIISFIKVISSSMTAITRNDALRIFCSVIRDYIIDFLCEKQYVATIEVAFSEAALKGTTSNDGLVKEFKRTIDYKSPSSNSTNREGLKPDGYWPSDTPADYMKSRFTYAHGSINLPLYLDYNQQAFWRDVQKITSLRLIQNSASIIIDHPGFDCVSSVLSTASLFSDLPVETFVISDDQIKDFESKLSTRMVSLFLKEVWDEDQQKFRSEESRFVRQRLWHIHFDLSCLNYHGVMEMIFQTVNMVSLVIHSQYKLQAGADLDISVLEELEKFARQQTPIVSFAVPLLPRGVLDEVTKLNLIL